MVITGSDLEGINALKSQLSLSFEMKDLGHLRYFLGIEVDRSSEGYFVSQVKYATEILHRAGLTDNKIVDTPLELNVKYNPTDGEILSNPTLYRQLVVVLRILGYLKGTLYQGLHFSSTSDLKLKAYFDSDWAGDLTDRRSTTGYCMFLGNSLISWRSKKQSVVSHSSAEAEYRALPHTTSEIVWLRWLLSDMGVYLSEPTPLFCDNKTAIHIAHNDVFHERTKHVEIDCHFVRHHYKKRTIGLHYANSELQIAYLFTKTYPSKRLQFLSSKLNMCCRPS
ncbi:uncharacterized protein LOC113351469 [Papaver somniferum]|uniref:uncharacterized protein LOC113351469 n=1 Tax=Papaver somniferum TaxID=3469 RepID=UPI000E6FDC3E|nr:uncharacterized protein LOC113351469 [Papaver somniferum]